MRRLGLVLALAATGGSLRGPSHGAPDRADVCQASKLQDAARHAGTLLSRNSAAAAQGTSVDAACESLEERRLSNSFAKAEGQGDCATRGDAAAVQSAIRGVIDPLSHSLRPDPGGTGSECSASKLSAAGQYLSHMLELYAKQRTSRNDTRLVQNHSNTRLKLRGAFLEAETGACQTTGDFDAVLARLDNLIGDLVEELWPLSASGVSFDRPAGWHLNPFPLAAGGDVELNNFSNAYLHGIVPPGGAVIFVTTDDRRTPSLRVLAEGDARQEGATIDSTLDILVGGESALQVIKHAPFDTTVGYKMIDIYVVHRAVRYKLGVQCWSNDPVDHVKAYDTFWRSVRFAERP